MGVNNPYGGEVRALTGLRGVAALFVVGFHCHTLFPGRPLPAIFGWGFLGVDVFFVLSGYVLASLYTDLAPTGYARFWLKRICRIYPLHVTIMVCLACVVGLAASFGFHAGHFYAAGSFLYVAALINIYTGDHGWNDPTWSIAVEMACYFAFPFVVSLLTRIARPKLMLVAFGLVVADAAFVASVATIDDGVTFFPIVGWIPITRGFLGFSAGCVLSRLVAMDTFRRGWICGLLGSRPLHRLGEISFSLYLLHQPIIEIFCKLDPVLARHRLGWVETPATLFAALALSCVTYARVEVPGRRVPEWLLAKTASMFQARPARATGDAAALEGTVGWRIPFGTVLRLR